MAYALPLQSGLYGLPSYGYSGAHQAKNRMTPTPNATKIDAARTKLMMSIYLFLPAQRLAIHATTRNATTDKMKTSLRVRTKITGRPP
jgi:hypothetical protein